MQEPHLVKFSQTFNLDNLQIKGIVTKTLKNMYCPYTYKKPPNTLKTSKNLEAKHTATKLQLSERTEKLATKGAHKSNLKVIKKIYPSKN